MKKRLHLLEILAWIMGLALVAIWGGSRLHAVFGSKSDLQKFQQAKEAVGSSPAPLQPETIAVDLELPAPEKEILVTTAEVDYTLWAEGRIKKYEESLLEDPGAPQAILRIPKLDLEVAVLEGTSDLVLNRGVGRIEGTAQVGEGGNLGLAGHRDGFFRGLKEIQVGDTMELETLSGTNTYVIDNISIVSPQDVYVLDPTEEARITLVTCYPFYFVGKAPLRYIVHSRAISDEEKVAARTMGSSP